MQKQIKPAVYDSLHILTSPLLLLNMEPNNLRKLKQTVLLFKGFHWRCAEGRGCIQLLLVNVPRGARAAPHRASAGLRGDLSNRDAPKGARSGKRLRLNFVLFHVFVNQTLSHRRACVVRSFVSGCVVFCVLWFFFLRISWERHLLSVNLTETSPRRNCCRSRIHCLITAPWYPETSA